MQSRSQSADNTSNKFPTVKVSESAKSEIDRLSYEAKQRKQKLTQWDIVDTWRKSHITGERQPYPLGTSIDEPIPTPQIPEEQTGQTAYSDEIESLLLILNHTQTLIAELAKRSADATSAAARIKETNHGIDLHNAGTATGSEGVETGLSPTMEELGRGEKKDIADASRGYRGGNQAGRRVPAKRAVKKQVAR